LLRANLHRLRDARLFPSRQKAARASGSTFFIPVVAMILGVVILHERVAPLAIAGCFVYLTGAWLMKRASAH